MLPLLFITSGITSEHVQTALISSLVLLVVETSCLFTPNDTLPVQFTLCFLRGMVNVVESIDPGNVARLPMHIRFSILTQLSYSPFTNLLVKLIQMIIPDGEDEEESITRHLDKRIW